VTELKTHMKPISAALFAAILLLAGCRSEGPLGGGGITHALSGSLTPDETVTFAVNGSAITLTCNPACSGPNHDTLTIAVNKNLQVITPSGDVAVLSFELKNNSDELPFDSNPATVVFRGSAMFNMRHSLPGGASSQPYYYHVFLFDPKTHTPYYSDPLIIIGR